MIFNRHSTRNRQVHHSYGNFLGIFTVLHEASTVSLRGEKYCRESCDTFQYCQLKNILIHCIYHCHPERENFDGNIRNLLILFISLTKQPLIKIIFLAFLSFIPHYEKADNTYSGYISG